MHYEPRLRVDRVAAELKEAGSPERALNEKRYLKSELAHYGASVPDIDKAAKRMLAEEAELSRGLLLALVEELWSRPVHELRMVAVELLSRRAALLETGDIGLLERLLRESKTWALLDTLAIRVLGPLTRRFDSLKPILHRWSRDTDFWLRRSVLLSYLLPMRQGDREVFDEFAAHAEAMLEERAFFIRKAIGWVLRERTKRNPDEVFRWLYPRAGRASGLTLREASKHLPEEQRERLLAAAAAGGASARSPGG